MVPPLDGNAARASADWPPVVIAGAFQTGVLAVRGLKRRGVRATCFDCNPRNPGFRSVYGPAHLCPNPDMEPDDWVRFMVGLAREMPGRPVLIPSSDQFVTAIAAHADTLAEHYVLGPQIALQGLLADKQTQYELAAGHRMPMPRTAFVSSELEVDDFLRQAALPCLIKPKHFREWQKFPPGHPLWYQKVAIAETAEQLRRSYRLASVINPKVILQEIIQGPDTAKRVYLACYDQTGRRIGNAMFRELRCDPLGFGPASISEPIEDPQTDAVCDRFLRSIGYVGICEIEMKHDSRDGCVKLIEANPRLSGGGDAAPYAGVDLCWLHYLDLIGQRVTPASPSGADFRHVVLRADGRALPAYWRAGLLSLKDIARSYRPPLAFFDLDARDWRSSARSLASALRSLASGMLGRRQQ